MLKVTALTVGDSGFVALPQEILNRLKVQAGDELVVTETQRGYFITKFDPENAADADGRAL